MTLEPAPTGEPVNEAVQKRRLVRNEGFPTTKKGNVVGNLLPEGDLLIHAGDFMSAETSLEEIVDSAQKRRLRQSQPALAEGHFRYASRSRYKVVQSCAGPVWIPPVTV
jgi:hypothetical protein